MQRSSYLQRCGGRCSRPVNQPRRRFIIVTRDYTEDGARPSNFVIAAGGGVRTSKAGAGARTLCRACVRVCGRRSVAVPLRPMLIADARAAQKRTRADSAAAAKLQMLSVGAAR